MGNSRNPARGWTFCGFGQTSMHPTELSLCPTSPMLCLFLAPPNPGQPRTLSLFPEHCPVRCPRGGMRAVKPSRLASCTRRPAPTASAFLWLRTGMWPSPPGEGQRHCLHSLAIMNTGKVLFHRRTQKPPLRIHTVVPSRGPWSSLRCPSTHCLLDVEAPREPCWVAWQSGTTTTVSEGHGPLLPAEQS